MCSQQQLADWDDTDHDSDSGVGYPSSSGETDYNYAGTLNSYGSNGNLNCTPEADLDSLGMDGDRDRPSLLNYYYTPELPSIESTVRWGFLLHAYGFACLFFFLAFYAFFSILNLRSQLASRPYMSTINTFLCLLGVSRAAVLFIDPYGLKKILPILMGTLLWDLGFPCLISSFSLIQIAFLQLTQLEVGPEKLRKKTCLSIIITVHFVTVVASSIYSHVNPDILIIKFIFQLGFSLWGFVLCGCFLYAGKRVLGILGGTSSDGPVGITVNEKGVAGLMAGLMAPGQNLTSSLTAALAPTLLQSSTPKIKITDENDRTISVASDSSRLNETCDSGRPSTPVPGPSKPNGESSGGCKERSGSGGSGLVRPPSPVLPRKKSGGSSSALRNCSGEMKLNSHKHQHRRLNFRRDSSAVENELFSSSSPRKKSLTWCENETGPSSKGGKKKEEEECTSLTVNADKPRRGSRKSGDFTEGATTAERSGTSSSGADALLSGGGGPDYTLQSILSHIAYVNQTALDYRLSRKLSRKNQVHKVIKYTSITALLGVLLCIGEIIRILSPYGILASDTDPPTPWPWFALNTVCRAVEFAMSAVIANITKQPVSRPPHHYAYSLRHKHPRESLYL